ncbi:hypothetical protein ACWGRJ_47475, partial [Bradyrhizobium sp. Lot11]
MRERQHSSSQLSFGFIESLPHLLPRQAFFVLTNEKPGVPRVARDYCLAVNTLSNLSISPGSTPRFNGLTPP